MVPAPLRRAVWSAYRQLGKSPGSRQAYDAAVQAAIDAVHQKQLARKGAADARTTPLF